MLTHGDAVAFPTFDRFAQREASRGKSLGELLEQSTSLRTANLRRLGELRLTREDLARPGRHPELGPVTLGMHLASWVVHDLDHLVQVARVMGRQYTEAVGPWRRYLRIVAEDPAGR
jgi:hypothetical protein